MSLRASPGTTPYAGMATLPSFLRRALLILVVSFSVAAAAGCGELGVVELGEDDPGDDAIPVPEEVLRHSGQERQAFDTGTPTVLFLNFDGETITHSPYTSDAAMNATFIGGGTIPPFKGDASLRSQIVTLVQQLYASFNIEIVTTRPASGDYGMVMIGGTSDDIGKPEWSNYSGIAPLDCGDKLPRDISFVFSEKIASLLKGMSSTLFAKHVAQTTAHEAGHTFGLPHSDDGCDVMSYGTCSQTKTFLDKTMGMQNPTSTTHNCNMTSMNSHQLLLAALGPASSEAPPAGGSEPLAFAYHASLVTLSYPTTMSAGSTADVTVKLKNEGTASWNSLTRLATSEPRNRESVFYTKNNWINKKRVAATGSTSPGSTATISFKLTAPMVCKDTAYSEHFNLVQDKLTGAIWFSDSNQGGPSDKTLVLKIEVTAVDADGDGFSSCYDCDDNDPAVYPGATEVCNGKDDNCDGQIDEGLDCPETSTEPKTGGGGSFGCQPYLDLTEGCVIAASADSREVSLPAPLLFLVVAGLALTRSRRRRRRCSARCRHPSE